MKNSEIIAAGIALADEISKDGDTEYEESHAAYQTAYQRQDVNTMRQRTIDMATANGKIKAAIKFRTKFIELKNTVKDDPELTPPGKEGGK